MYACVAPEPMMLSSAGTILEIAVAGKQGVGRQPQGISTTGAVEDRRFDTVDPKRTEAVTAFVLNGDLAVADDDRHLLNADGFQASQHILEDRRAVNID